MKRLNITVSDEVFKYIEELKNKEKVNRSELIRKAIILYKNEFEKRLKEKERKDRIAQAIQRINQLRESTGVWDGVSKVREFRDTRRKPY